MEQCQQQGLTPLQLLRRQVRLAPLAANADLLAD